MEAIVSLHHYIFQDKKGYGPASNYQFKINNRSTGKWCEICSKLRTMTPERHQWIRFGVFIVNFENISHVFTCFLGWLWASICLLGNSFFTRIILTKFETVQYMWDTSASHVGERETGEEI